LRLQQGVQKETLSFGCVLCLAHEATLRPLRRLANQVQQEVSHARYACPPQKDCLERLTQTQNQHDTQILRIFPA
jgi:hypothetical protein